MNCSDISWRSEMQRNTNWDRGQGEGSETATRSIRNASSDKDSEHHVLLAWLPAHRGNSRSGMGCITAARSSSSHISRVVCLRPSCRCLCCVLSFQDKLASACLCACVIDTRRRGGDACDSSAAVSFMQLHHHRQDTSNHAQQCHHCVCVCGSPKASSAGRCGGAPYIYHCGYDQHRGSRFPAVCRSCVGLSGALAVSMSGLLFHLWRIG